MRVLLWGVEKLVAGLGAIGADTDVDSRLHVVLPGSPNRGIFGGDGAYGEAKAALDAMIAKWGSEKSWSQRVTFVHAIIGWVRGTGLMGHNDPLVEAVEAAGVSTWSTTGIAGELLRWCTPEFRRAAADGPVTVDLTGGLGTADLMSALAADGQHPAESSNWRPAHRGAAALPPWPTTSVEWGEVTQALDEMVVIVGATRSALRRARTRFESRPPVNSRPPASWSWPGPPGSSPGRTRHRRTVTSTGEPITSQIASISARSGGWACVATDDQAPDVRQLRAAAPRCSCRRTCPSSWTTGPGPPTWRRPEHGRHLREDGEWTVTRKAGTEIRVPRRTTLTRVVGGQIPTGFDPTAWGIPADMVSGIDRVAAWNLVATVDAFISSGFTPAELLAHVHPADVANTQGTGMGGMTSMRSLYIDGILGRSRANDILQEALPNVVAAHV